MKNKKINRRIRRIILWIVLIGTLNYVVELKEIKAEVQSGNTKFVNSEFEFGITGENTAVVLKYNGNSRKVIVPNEVDGYMITEIGQAAFCDNTIIEEVVLGKNIEVVNKNAYNGATSLEKITLSENIRKIEVGAFNNTNLYENDNGLVYVEYICFGREKGNEDSDVKIREGTTIVADYAFRNDENMEKLELPDTLKYIGEGSFHYAVNLRSVNIPHTIEKIEAMAFYNDCNLTEISENVEYAKDNVFAFGQTQLFSNYLLQKICKTMGILIFTIFILSSIVIMGKKIISKKIAKYKLYNYSEVRGNY